MQLLKNCRNCEKTQRYYICHNRKIKKPFGVRTKLSYYKVFQKTFAGYRNEKNPNIYK